MSDAEMIKQMYEHFLVWNKEFGAIQAQMDFIMKFFWIVTTASMGSAVASIWSLLLHKGRDRR